MNRRDLKCRIEPNRKFVEPGRHGPGLLETADPAFDRVPGLVVLAVALLTSPLGVWVCSCCPSPWA